MSRPSFMGLLVGALLVCCWTVRAGDANFVKVAGLPPAWEQLAQEGGLGQEVVAKVLLPPSLAFTSPGNHEEWVEAAPITIRWDSTGPIEKVTLYCYGDNTKLGGHSRGSFGFVIADKTTNTGSYKWTVPWIDAGSFVLRLAGYDGQGKKLAETERGVAFRASELNGLSGTYIGILKRKQRLYYYQDNKLRRIHIVSTARSPFYTPTMRPGSGGRRGSMGRVFYKDPNAFSRMYQVPMLWWMAITSSGSHGIHATSPGYYDELGSPASHGCVRQHRADAKVLYGMVSVGTSVYVF